MFEREIYKDYKDITRKHTKQKKISLPYLYMYLEDDKTRGYVNYGSIMMLIYTHNEERISEKEKFWFEKRYYF